MKKIPLRSVIFIYESLKSIFLKNDLKYSVKSVTELCFRNFLRANQFRESVP